MRKLWIALALGLAVTGCATEAPAAVTVTATVTATEPAPPAVVTTTTVSVTEVGGVAAEGESFGNGTYLIGFDIQPGTYVCADPWKEPYWVVTDTGGGIVANDNNTRAIIERGGFQVEFKRCNSGWVLEK